MTATILNNVDVTPLEDLILQDGKIVPIAFDVLNTFPQHMISVFCHKHAVYQVPTTELIDFLQSEISGSVRPIEIGSGNGCIGRSLCIPKTDNKMQEWASVKQIYKLSGQPTINYGQDVEEIDAIAAVKKYTSETVVACWVTHLFKPGMKMGNMHGIAEESLFENGVKKYIHVGNESIHSEKPILNKYSYKKLQFPWLVSRSLKRELNCIYIFTA